MADRPCDLPDGSKCTTWPHQCGDCKHDLRAPPADRLDEIKALAEASKAATSGRWIAHKRKDGSVQIYSPAMGPCRAIVPVAETEEQHADYLAAVSPDAVLALIAEVERLREEAAKRLGMCCTNLGRGTAEICPKPAGHRGDHG